MREMLKKQGRKILALSLAVLMVFGVAPVSAGTVKAADATSITLTDIKNFARQDGSNRYLFTVSGVSDQTNQYGNYNVAYIDGVAVTTDIWYAPAGGDFADSLYFLVGAGAFGKEKITDVTGEHTIEIKAGTTIGANNAENPGTGGKYEIANDLSWKVNGTSVRQNLPTETLDIDITTVADAPNGNGFYFRTCAEEHHPYDGSWGTNSYFVTGGVYINGVLNTNVFLKKLDPNKYYVCLLDAGATVQPNDVVTIEGAVQGNGYETVFNKKEFVYQGGYWKVVLPTETVSICNSKVDNDASYRTGAGFCMMTEQEDSQAYNGDWSVSYNFIDGGVSVNGAEAINVPLKKLQKQVYYVALSDVGATASAGDKITISGSIQGAEKETIFKTHTFLYGGEEKGWSDYHEGTHTDAVPADCTTDGMKEYWTCTECGKIFADAEYTTETTLEALVDKAHHTPVKTNAVESDCANEGTEAYWTCSVCKKLFSDEACTKEIGSPVTMPKKSHTPVKVEGKAATCTADGYETYYECSGCKALFADEAATTPIDAPKVIAKHKATFVKAVASTYTKTGMKAYYKCSCGKLYMDKALTKVTTKAKLTVAKKTLAKPAVKSAAGKSKATLVKWAKKSGVTGYEIQVYSDKKCKKIVKKTTVKGASKVSATVKGLKGKKTYYVRIRTYKTEGKLKAYSAWSSAKKVTTKK